MFIPVPSAALAVVQYNTHDDQSFSNTLWFTCPDYSDLDMAALAAVVDGSVENDLLPYMASGTSYVRTTVYDMRTETGAIVVEADGAGPGGVAMEMLPIQVAMVLTLYTSARGRSGRGRLYIGGLPESQMDNGSWTTTAIGYVMAWAGTLQSNAAATGWTWCVVSRYSQGQPLTEGVARPIINRQVRSDLPGTQRRRLDRP